MENVKMYNGLIYRCYCIESGKNYIGQTRTSLNERIRSHRWRAIHDPSNFYFYNAWNKYGEQSLEWSVLERVVADSLENLCKLLNQREIYWIDKYDSFKNGYNLTPGGQSWFGSFTKVGVKVFKENGEFINIYDSIREAAEEFKIDNSGITKCCKRILRTTGKKDGYRLIFRYIDDTYTQEDADLLDPIIFDAYLYETDEYIGTYKSANELLQEFNVCKTSISQNLHKKSKYIRTKDGIKLYLKYKKWNINNGTDN